MLNTSCQLSYEKISTLFADLFGYDLNESTAVSNNKLAHERLEATEGQIKEVLIEGEVTHFDESGIKVGTNLRWLHTACSTLFTYLFVSEKWGTKAHQTEVSILSRIKNWAVHDCYATYFKFFNCRHALCNPHILRELQAQVELGKLWAKDLQTFLLELYKKSEKGTKTVPRPQPVHLRAFPAYPPAGLPHRWLGSVRVGMCHVGHLCAVGGRRRCH